MTASCSLRSWAPFPEPACPAALTSTALRPGRAFLCSHPGLWHCTCTHTHMHTHTHRGMVCFQASRPPLPPDAHTRTHVPHAHMCTHTHAHTHREAWFASRLLDLPSLLTHTHTCAHTHTCTHTQRGMVCFQASRSPLPPDAHTRTHVHTHRGVVCFQAPRAPLSPDPQSHVLLGTWCPPLLLSLATGPTSRLSPSAQDLTNTEAAPGPGQASVGPLRGLPWVS